MTSSNSILTKRLTEYGLSLDQIKKVRKLVKSFLSEDDDSNNSLYYIEIIGLFEYIKSESQSENKEIAIEKQIKQIEDALTNNLDFDTLIHNANNQAKNKIALQNEIKATRQKTELPVIDKFCKYCGVVRKIEFQSIQTRGGDEAATIFYTCTVCNTKWKSRG